MKKDFIFTDVSNLRGVGPQLSKYLKKKKIEKIKDIILSLPYSETDRSNIFKLNELEKDINHIDDLMKQAPDRIILGKPDDDKRTDK